MPYRDSKLTRIFQRALTGHERITMIVNANTSPMLFDETVNVLNFSAIAKQIVLETPIKRAKRPEKKSRFSIMVSQPNPHGTICWDAPPQRELKKAYSLVSTCEGDSNISSLNVLQLMTASIHLADQAQAWMLLKNIMPKIRYVQWL